MRPTLKRFTPVLLLLLALSCGDGGDGGASNDPGSGGNGGSGGGSAGSGTLAGCQVFPADNPWNRDVSSDPVDGNSDAYIRSMNGGRTNLHADFGSPVEYGIPWISVPGSQPRVPVSFYYRDESDPGPYPFPLDAPVEAGGDRHILAVDRDNCRLYEAFDCERDGGGWACGSGAVFDLRSNTLRPDGWTSADAAGLPILPGLARLDEVERGEIRHALRFTVRRTQRAYIHPATHFASSDRNPDLPPMGLRVRMKASYDIGGVTGAARVILVALKKYGMFVADNGSDWFISGERNPRWNDDDLDQLKRIPGSAFEVVRAGDLHR